MRIQSIQLLCAAALLFGFGCKRIPYVESTPNSIFPLSAGLWWEYAETIVISDSTAVLEILQDTIRCEVLRKGYLDRNDPDFDAPYVHLETFELRMTRTGNESIHFLRPESGGIFQIALQIRGYDEDSENPCELLNVNRGSSTVLLPYPDIALSANYQPPFFAWGCVNDSSFAAFQYEADYRLRFLALIGPEPVSVPAGTFNAINFSNVEWWAPGIGLVKTAESFDGFQVPFRHYHVLRELTAYGE